jgi:hypothetical protein
LAFRGTFLGQGRAIAERVHQLLWNNGVRASINAYKLGLANAAAEVEMKEYLQDCLLAKRVMPNGAIVWAIRERHLAGRMFLPIEENQSEGPNAEIPNHVATRVMAVWCLALNEGFVQLHLGTFTDVAFFLGVLYIMRDGWYGNGAPIVPQSTALHVMLPQPSDLCYFGQYQERDVGLGIQLMRALHTYVCRIPGREAGIAGAFVSGALADGDSLRLEEEEDDDRDCDADDDDDGGASEWD